MSTIFIKSGEWDVRGPNDIIRTDLGSCVALCLWDSSQMLGGMNHYLLPGTEGSLSENTSEGYYANQSLLYAMLRSGATLKTLQGAIIGGGQLYPENDFFGIGDSNVIAAEFILEKHRIPLVFKRTGGSMSRSVELDVESGQIHVREILLGSGTMTHYWHHFLKD